jgi:hypothetical protein
VLTKIYYFPSTGLPHYLEYLEKYGFSENSGKTWKTPRNVLTFWVIQGKLGEFLLLLFVILHDIFIWFYCSFSNFKINKFRNFSTHDGFQWTNFSNKNLPCDFIEFLGISICSEINNLSIITSRSHHIAAAPHRVAPHRGVSPPSEVASHQRSHHVPGPTTSEVAPRPCVAQSRKNYVKRFRCKFILKVVTFTGNGFSEIHEFCLQS